MQPFEYVRVSRSSQGSSAQRSSPQTGSKCCVHISGRGSVQGTNAAPGAVGGSGSVARAPLQPSTEPSRASPAQRACLGDRQLGGMCRA